MIRSNQKAFTIAELLVVIAIIGLLTAMVMINFRHGNQTNDLRQAGTELLQNFRLAQSYTIGGNSINYCIAASASNNLKPCADDVSCGGTVDSCKNGVPLGGYGINIASTEIYTLFGDTYGNPGPSIYLANHYFDGAGSDYSVIEKNLLTKGLHLASYKFNGESAKTPSASQILDITFEPPAGIVHFYLNHIDAVNGSGQLYTTLEILVASDFLSNTCRKITVNRVSGQVSESQSGCSL